MYVTGVEYGSEGQYRKKIRIDTDLFCVHK